MVGSSDVARVVPSGMVSKVGLMAFAGPAQVAVRLYTTAFSSPLDLHLHATERTDGWVLYAPPICALTQR